MGERLPPKELELYKRCDEILHYVWDPFGVAGFPSARNEYEGHLPQVWRMVRDQVEADKIVEHLISLEKEQMQVQVSGDRARRAVEKMTQWRNWIWQVED